MTLPSPPPLLPLDVTVIEPGLRLTVGLSGGADSVALTRALAARAGELGIVLHAAHLHHGLRGVEADEDLRFCADLAGSLNLPFHSLRVETSAEAAAQPESGKSRETIEEAARRIRYAWFRRLMASREIDAVATAHTVDDQAETVLGKFLRGAWTEGFSGIHPVVIYPEGRILRPLLGANRAQVEAYLKALGQNWREDATNLDPAYTRNRLRRQLLPELEKENPRIRENLAHLAELARDEEAYWDTEVSRLAAQLILTGKPVRGGGRASEAGETVALDVVRLGAQPVAVQRRLLRWAARIMDVSLNFEATESLRELATHGRSGQRLALPGWLTAERTPREIRLSRGAPGSKGQSAAPVELPVPGETHAFGIRFRAQAHQSGAPALIRNWRPGDRVTLRYSTGPRKIKEVLERLKITGTARSEWPVVEWQGKIVWMKGAELQPTPSLTITTADDSTEDASS